MQKDEQSTTSTAFELKLMGRLRLVHHGGAEVTPRSKKAQGLLALVGVAPELRRPRSYLQDKLWSDRGAEQAAASLRQALAEVRRAFGEQRNVIINEAGWVGFDPDRLSVSLEPDEGDYGLSGDIPEFASGLDINDPEFERWVRDKRASFAERMAADSQPTTLSSRSHKSGEPYYESSLPSVAVMPLAVLSENGSASFVAKGIVIDVIGRLTRFKRVDVIAHTSTAALAGGGLSAREVGRRLGSRYVIEGALRLTQRRMRLSLDLIDAESEVVLWSNDWNRAFEDIFEVESEIANAVCAEMMVEIDRLERIRARARDPETLATYELCLRGLDAILKLDADSCRDAQKMLADATAREPQYARALAAVSRSYGFQWKYRWTPDRDEALAMADKFAVRAVDADSNDASAHAGLGWVALYSREHEASLSAYKRAMELNPSDADIIAEYADSLKHNGSPTLAMPLFERAIRLNPHNADHYLKDLAHTHFVAEDFDGAIRSVQRMVQPRLSLRVLTASYAMAGQDEKARSAAETVRRLFPNFSSEEWVAMVPDRQESYRALFLEGLKRAGL